MKKIFIVSSLVVVGLLFSGCGSKDVPDCGDKIVLKVLDRILKDQMKDQLDDEELFMVNVFNFKLSSFMTEKTDSKTIYCKAKIDIDIDEKIAKSEFKKIGLDVKEAQPIINEIKKEMKAHSKNEYFEYSARYTDDKKEVFVQVLTQL